MPLRTELKRVHGKLRRVKICPPAPAMGVGGGYNSTHSHFHYADLGGRGSKPRRYKIAIDPDDERSKHWLRKHRLEDRP